MARERPAWQPFDPEEPGTGVSLPPRDPDGPTRVLVLLAGEHAARDGWAPRAAVSLVRKLASENGRALLADLALLEPRLHEILGVANDEGVSDVLLWGASFHRVAHAVEPGLLFAPAGTVVADPAAVSGSSRWGAIVDGFGQARATLVLYVPEDTPGLPHLLEHASDVVLLAAREEVERVVPDGSVARIRAVLGPGEPEAAGGPPPRPEGGTGEPESPDPEADTRDRGWEEEISRAAAAATAGRRRRGPAVWMGLALLVVAAFLVAVWAGWVNVPYLTPLLTGSADASAAASPGEAGAAGAAAGAPDEDPETPPSEDPPAGAAGEPGDDPAAVQTPPAEGATPTEDPAAIVAADAPVQRFSLQLGAFPDAEGALESVRGMRARRPDMTFVLAPAEVDGSRFHRVLAGLSETAGGMAEQRESLGETLGAEAAGGWIVRDAGWAYLLDELPTLAEARARAGTVASGAVDPYVLQVPSAGGGAVYRVYAGAYADSADASAMGGLLAELDLAAAPLVPRVGTLAR